MNRNREARERSGADEVEFGKFVLEDSPQQIWLDTHFWNTLSSALSTDVALDVDRVTREGNRATFINTRGPSNVT